jgi:mRNA-degrading endonuclease RelE of RelBE toxin-antitoxin system
MTKVRLSRTFEKEAKKLIKKHRSLAGEISELISSLEQTPNLDTPIGKDCFKIRLAIKSKEKGKSGGARVITCLVAVQETVVLLSIYDKAEQADISDEQLSNLLFDLNIR